MLHDLNHDERVHRNVLGVGYSRFPVLHLAGDFVSWSGTRTWQAVR